MEYSTDDVMAAVRAITESTPLESNLKVDVEAALNALPNIYDKWALVLDAQGYTPKEIAYRLYGTEDRKRGQYRVSAARKRLLESINGR